MATKLYLHDATNDQAGTYPSGEQSNYPSYGGGQSHSMANASTLRKMNTSIGAGQVAPTFTSLNNQTTQEIFLRMWTSRPLDGSQTVGGGNFILNFAHAESNTNVNLWRYGVNIYVWRPSTGAKIGTVKAVLGAVNSIVGTEPSNANSERVWHVSGITSSAISAQDDDVVIFELYVDFAQGMSTAYTGTLYYDGTTENATANAAVSNHASYIEFAESLVFQSPSNRRVIVTGEP